VSALPVKFAILLSLEESSSAIDAKYPALMSELIISDLFALDTAVTLS
jgi:hypothetical protein